MSKDYPPEEAVVLMQRDRQPLTLTSLCFFLPSISGMHKHETDSDPLLISILQNTRCLMHLKIPESLYQLLESSSDSEETVRGTRSS